MNNFWTFLIKFSNLRKNKKSEEDLLSHKVSAKKTGSTSGLNETLVKQGSVDSENKSIEKINSVKQLADMHSVSSSNFLSVIQRDYTLNDSQPNLNDNNNNNSNNNDSESRRSSNNSLKNMIILKKFNLKDLVGLSSIDKDNKHENLKGEFSLTNIFY